MGELLRVLADIGDDPAARVLVVTGEGRGFCSGLDVREFGPSMPAAAPRPLIGCASRST